MPRNMNPKQVSKRSTSASAILKSSCPQHVIETDPLAQQKAQWIHDYLSKLPPGLRFAPSDAELIRDYLKPKIENNPLPICLIHPVNLYSSHPRTLAETHLKHPDVEETYYFTPRDRKYKNGERPNRGVGVGNHTFGYWKPTGSDGQIKIGEELIGYTKTLVFYEGKPSAGKKTNWIMHEYRVCASKKRTPDGNMKLDDWVLCKVREKVKTVSFKNKKRNEEANLNANEGDTNTENAKDVDVVKDEENTFVNEKKCSTSQNDYPQSHQDLALPWPQNSHYPLNTDRGMISDIDGSGSIYEGLSPVPGTSYSSTCGPKFCEDWEYGLMCNTPKFCEDLDYEFMCDNVFDSGPTCVVQDRTNDPTFVVQDRTNDPTFVVQDNSWVWDVEGSGNSQVQDRTNDHTNDQ